MEPGEAGGAESLTDLEEGTGDAAILWSWETFRPSGPSVPSWKPHVLIHGSRERTFPAVPAENERLSVDGRTSAGT